MDLPWIKRVPDWGVLVIYRWGRLDEKLLRQPGLRFLIPLADRGVVVDLREQSVEVPRQTCPTSDEEAIGVTMAVSWKITDPLLSQARVLNFGGAVQGVAATIARSIVAEMTAADALRKAAWMGEKIREKLGEVVRNWGGVVTDVSVVELTKL